MPVVAAAPEVPKATPRASDSTARVWPVAAGRRQHPAAELADLHSGSSASTRAGAPLAPRTFSGATTTGARGGNWSRLARFSRISRPPSSQIRCSP